MLWIVFETHRWSPIAHFNREKLWAVGSWLRFPTQWVPGHCEHQNQKCVAGLGGVEIRKTREIAGVSLAFWFPNEGCDYNELTRSLLLQWSDACSLESGPVFSGRRKQPAKEGSSKAALPPNPQGSTARTGSWGSRNGKVEGRCHPSCLAAHLCINRALRLWAVSLDRFH